MKNISLTLYTLLFSSLIIAMEEPAQRFILFDHDTSNRQTARLLMPVTYYDFAKVKECVENGADVWTIHRINKKSVLALMYAAGYYHVAEQFEDYLKTILMCQRDYNDYVDYSESFTNISKQYSPAMHASANSSKWSESHKVSRRYRSQKLPTSRLPDLLADNWHLPITFASCESTTDQKARRPKLYQTPSDR